MPVSTALDTARAAALFHALSDAIRLEVVVLLADGEQCVCDLQASLDMAQSKLSWHLKTLKEAGIITDRRQGRWVYYSLNPDALGEAKGIIDSLKPSRRLPIRSAC
jgi:ArsR family transcriptional regulator, arsenate/arsenite/antimonite-responsive transcriptional repressor